MEKLYEKCYRWFSMDGFYGCRLIVAPIAIAGLFGLNAEESAGFVQRTMFILGVSGFLQAVFGHRLPINEGPAGLWWGVFVLYGGLSTALFFFGIGNSYGSSRSDDCQRACVYYFGSRKFCR